MNVTADITKQEKSLTAHHSLTRSFSLASVDVHRLGIKEFGKYVFRGATSSGEKIGILDEMHKFSLGEGEGFPIYFQMWCSSPTI